MLNALLNPEACKDDLIKALNISGEPVEYRLLLYNFIEIRMGRRPISWAGKIIKSMREHGFTRNEQLKIVNITRVSEYEEEWIKWINEKNS